MARRSGVKRIPGIGKRSTEASRINLLRGPIASLRGARSSPIALICLVAAFRPLRTGGARPDFFTASERRAFAFFPAPTDQAGIASTCAVIGKWSAFRQMTTPAPRRNPRFSGSKKCRRDWRPGCAVLVVASALGPGETRDCKAATIWTRRPSIQPVTSDSSRFCRYPAQDACHET